MSRLILITLLLSTSLLFAADDGPLSHRATPQKALPGQIRVNVDLALVPVYVTDTYGRSVTGLGRENFRVFEGKRQMPIETFGSQDMPVTVGLIFDCSRSMRDKFATAREAAREFFQQLNPDDESFLITISDKPELKYSLTNDFRDLQSSLLFVNPSGSTSLLDGVYMGLQQIRKAHNPRKALVVVSDGGENNSRYTEHELMNIAVEADTQIFSIGLHNDPQSAEEMMGPALLGELSGKTGGLDFNVESLSKLHVAMAKVGVSLHNQYVLGYYPPDNAVSGKYRKIKVELLVPRGTAALEVHARSGYFVK